MHLSRAPRPATLYHLATYVPASYLHGIAVSLSRVYACVVAHRYLYWRLLDKPIGITL